MKKLTVVGVMVISCFMHAMDEKKSKPNKAARLYINRMMKLNQAMEHGYEPENKGPKIASLARAVFYGRDGEKFIFSSDGSVIIRDDAGNLVWGPDHSFEELEQLREKFKKCRKKREKELKKMAVSMSALPPLITRNEVPIVSTVSAGSSPVIELTELKFTPPVVTSAKAPCASFSCLSLSPSIAAASSTASFSSNASSSTSGNSSALILSSSSSSNSLSNSSIVSETPSQPTTQSAERRGWFGWW